MRENTYADEVVAERAYVGELYARLDTERARVGELYAETLREQGISPMERDAQVRALGREVSRLNVADNGLCFGRIDGVDGTRSYIGRIGLFDEADEFEPLLLDWRAPAARAFYVATAASPEGMSRRRQFHTRGREVVDFTDEALGKPDASAGGDAALLAAVSAPRGEHMRDIVATIQAEQDEIIRLDNAGVVVIEGGPGTGKTVVALHRVAYLLYTQRERMQRQGVLVVGPNPAFLDHIAHVLPSLGETNVVFTTTGGLLPGLVATAEDAPEVVALKGSLTMVDVLAAAVADRQRLPAEPVVIELADVALRVDAPTVEWARDEARGSDRPHNQARSVFLDVLTWALTERAIGKIGKGWLTRDDREAWEHMRADLLSELAEHADFRALIDDLWPLLEPEDVLAELLSSPARLASAGADPILHRENGSAWTVSDVALLDELIELLGPIPVDDSAAKAEAKQEAAYAAAVLDTLVQREDHMDDEDHLFAQDMLFGTDLADRFVERDTRVLAERAAADRDWTYRHIVVDEAQELSAMDWRVLMRRCPAKSFTIVGDLAQRRSAAGATSWGAMLDDYVPGRWAYRQLTVNYRTPAEIMAVAADVLAEFAPDLKPAESVRECGVQPWSRQVTDRIEMATAIKQFTETEAALPGTSIIIGPPDIEGTTPAAATKGLEYDSVLIIDPDHLLTDTTRGAADLYVALTRATQRLGVLHTAPLPPMLAGLAEVPAA
ncbi:RNA polymerase recycling motor ATPase HelR [Nocardia camponoti]|uniref:DNA helicase n=1 Tax=Nocardia camponoti TaxID=1616106 RepID=A0A917Q9D7_9NOCA|nr:RNA polymerase recycling motor ATPase HelR [Nocardia camponoti]GGK36217.1 DNA helicase [Nocardia camponoti]